jgi:hypothetical protein
MENFRTDEEILSAVTGSDNHPRKGLVDINKAREWVKNIWRRLGKQYCR